MRPGTPPAPGLLPRSLVASASVHALLLAAGVVWGALAGGADRAGPRVYALSFDAPRPAPMEEREELRAEEPRADESEPVLRERELSEEPAVRAEPTASAPALRAVDWLDARRLEIASLPTRPEPAPAIAAPVTVARSVAPPGAVADAPEPRAIAVVSAPEPLHQPPPAYPRLARRASEEGSVLCRLHLAADGSVTRVEVVESSGFARLDESARETLALWRFRPRLEAGRAVATTLLHRVTFRLES